MTHRFLPSLLLLLAVVGYSLCFSMQMNRELVGNELTEFQAALTREISKVER